MDKIAIVYWSGTGNTEAMAKAMEEGAKSTGAEVDLFEVSATNAASVGAYAKIAFGCPSMGDEVLEEGEFEPFFTEIEPALSGKKIALFGSYGWGDGQWMRDWEERAKNAGADLFDGKGLIVNDAPEGAECTDFGAKFAAY